MSNRERTKIGDRWVERRNVVRGVREIVKFTGLTARKFNDSKNQDPVHWLWRWPIIRKEGKAFETTESELRAAAKAAGVRLPRDPYVDHCNYGGSV